MYFGLYIDPCLDKQRLAVRVDEHLRVAKIDPSISDARKVQAVERCIS